jgi:hypothetical protein
MAVKIHRSRSSKDITSAVPQIGRILSSCLSTHDHTSKIDKKMIGLQMEPHPVYCNNLATIN